jgi:protein ImuB
MYACIHLPGILDAIATKPGLVALAREFSPEVEHTSADTVVFSITPLRAILGPPYQIASEISRRGYERDLDAHLAIAANPDTAILLARQFAGVTLVASGEEASQLASLPLENLFAHNVPVDPTLLDTLHQWGLETCEDLAVLPEAGLRERLGLAAVYLRNMALGRINRPLRIAAREADYEEQMELEHPLDRLEPLLFLFGRALGDLCGRLRSQSEAARILEARLVLDGKPEYQCRLEFPVPLTDSRTMLKLLQLHLEHHSPEALVVGFKLRIEPVAPRRMQSDLFLPPTPQPDKLQVTLARIAALVGDENVGTPQLLNTFRPDAFRFTTLNGSLFEQKPDDFRRQILRLSMRIFRPPVAARVYVADFVPRRIVAGSVKGRVVEWSGPWKTSGEWWSSHAWSREEWDVELDDGALYRIYRDLPASLWYVQGAYD